MTVDDIVEALPKYEMFRSTPCSRVMNMIRMHLLMQARHLCSLLKQTKPAYKACDAISDS